MPGRQRYFSNAMLCAPCWRPCPCMLAGAFCPEALLRLMGGDAGIVDAGHALRPHLLAVRARSLCATTSFRPLSATMAIPHLAMVATLSGSLFNVVFDYIFMFPLGLGLPGAALATAVSPMHQHRHLQPPFSSKGTTPSALVRQMPSAKLLAQSCQLGISGFVGELSSGVTTTVFNFLLLRLAGNVAVAAYGVVANYALVATAIFNGVAQGAQPLVSRCYGQNDARRCPETPAAGQRNSAGAGGGAVCSAVRPHRYRSSAGLQQRELGAHGAVRPHRDAHLLRRLLLRRL
ncbi:MAG: MATE family efflux transporter [Faecalibacterium prausnitzii]